MAPDDLANYLGFDCNVRRMRDCGVVGDAKRLGSCESELIWCVEQTRRVSEVLFILPRLRVGFVVHEGHEAEGAQVFADELLAVAGEADHLLVC